MGTNLRIKKLGVFGNLHGKEGMWVYILLTPAIPRGPLLVRKYLNNYMFKAPGYGVN